MTRRSTLGVHAGRGRAALLVGIGAALVLMTGCGDDGPVRPGPPVSVVPDYTLAELRAAPEELKFGGIVYTVDAELWRDFMPVSPPDGSPLAAYVRATAVGASVFPAEITAVYVWVLNGDEVWAAKMDFDPSIPQPPGARMYAAHGGPKWGPEIDVEVVVGFRAIGGALHLVRIPSVPIRRSE